MSIERYDSVRRIMADISAAKIGDTAHRAPMFDHRDLIHCKHRIIVGNLAAPAKPDPGDLADFGVTADVKQSPVNPVHIFSDFLDHQDMTA
jgi:hypothetical protein